MGDVITPLAGTTRTARVGAGTGFAGDRLDGALELLRRAGLDDLVLECLAERTIALSQLSRIHDPSLGYDERLVERLGALLPLAAAGGTRVLTNMGAANPPAAGRAAQRLVDELGLPTRVAVVTGDDVLEQLDGSALAAEDGRSLESHGEIVSANAYLGADALLPALRVGADLVIAGRVADPSLYVAALVDRLGWDMADWPRLATATMVGHLLECAGQLTGGYYADPGRKDVPGLDRLGFPFAEVGADATAVVTKLADTGGVLDVATATEQLLYEITDVSGYVTPDVVLDLRGATLTQLGTDRVGLGGAEGGPRPDELKVSVGYRAGVRADAEIIYAGANSRARARLAVETLQRRVRGAAARVEYLLIDGTATSARDSYEVSLVRLSGMAQDRAGADDLAHEVEALYTNGPAAGGGVRYVTKPVVGIVSTYLPREAVTVKTTILKGGGVGALA